LHHGIIIHFPTIAFFARLPYSILSHTRLFSRRSFMQHFISVTCRCVSTSILSHTRLFPVGHSCSTLFPSLAVACLLPSSHTRLFSVGHSCSTSFPSLAVACLLPSSYIHVFFPSVIHAALHFRHLLLPAVWVWCFSGRATAAWQVTCSTACSTGGIKHP